MVSPPKAADLAPSVGLATTWPLACERLELVELAFSMRCSGRGLLAPLLLIHGEELAFESRESPMVEGIHVLTLAPSP